MKNFFLVLSFLFSSVFAFSQCVLIDIQVLSEPYCPGSLNGGQLQANVSGGAGFYTYEWLNENGGNLPGGPQTSAITNSFLPANQAIWVFVTDTFQNCIDSASYTFTSYSCDPDTAKLEISSLFDINPVGYNTYTECDVKLTNLGCQVSFKPEFIVSHITDTLEQGDFIIDYFNAQSVWEVIPYTINSDGDAIGYWGGQSGQNLNCEEERVRPVRVKFNQFNPEAPLGEYTASLRLWSVDQSGNLLSIISEQDQVTVTLMDTICNTLSISSTVTDASCPEQTDGQIQISSIGGQSPYEYSVNNSTFSSNGLYTSLSSGTYILVVKDSLGCQESVTVFIYPEPSLPDTLWFTAITPFDAVINWTADSTVDGYRFRYREVGQTWQIVASGIFDDNIAEILSSKSLSGLTPSTTYEVQVRTNSLIDCIEGWSTTYIFTTTMESYNYDVRHTCSGVNSGQILFDVQTLNSYTFEWTGPNGFSSTDTSIYQLAQGDYNLEVSNNNSQIIFDTIISIEVSNSSIDLTLNGDTSLIFESTTGLFFAQTCDLNSYLIADSGFTNYQWSDGTTTGQQFLIDTSDVFILVEALDSNNCPSISDSVHISIITDYVDLIQANTNQAYIQSNYTLCSSGSSIEIDISPFVSGNYLVEWHQVVGQNFLILGDSSVIEIFPTQSSNYVLELGNCFFDFSIDYYSPVLDVSNTNLLCNGDTNAYIIVSSDSSSSTAHFILKDSLGVEVYNNISNQLIDTIFGLSSNKYTVELLDEWMCLTSTIVDVTQPDSFYFDSLIITDVICHGDSSGVIDYVLNGGTSPFDYVINSDTSILSNALASGAYTIEIIDSNNCIIDTNFVVNEPTVLSLSVIDSLTNDISCFGNNDGQIGLTASGGVPPYKFKIDGVLKDTNVIIELLADTFIVAVVDSVGCEDTLEVVLSQPQQNVFVDNYTLSDTLGYCAPCYGDSTGFITIDLLGGTAPFDYFIVSNPDTFNTLPIEKLVGGTEYEIYAKDSLGCVSDTITVECNSPDEIVMSLDLITEPRCCYSCDAEVNLKAVGGITPFVYGIEAMPFQVDSMFSQLCGDTSYLFRVEDSFGCLKLDSMVVPNIPCLTVDTINFVDSQYPAILSDSCQIEGTGKIHVTASEGTGNYNFSINDTMNFIESQQYIYNNLSQGEYVIFVKDSLSCIDSINVEVPEITPITIQLLLDTVYCASPFLNDLTNQTDEGGFTVQAFGSITNTYSYSLDEWDSTIFLNQGVFTLLDTGNYSLNVKDGFDCLSEFEVNVPSISMNYDYTAHDISCAGFNDGYVQINSLQGDVASPWVEVDNSLPNNPNLFTNLGVGEHVITAYYNYPDGSSFCYKTDTFEFFEKEELYFSLEVNSVSCYDDCDASISIDSTYGGAEPYAFICLNNLDTNYLFENLCAGEYSIKMIDDNGCLLIEDIAVNEGNAIYPLISFEDGELTVVQPTLQNPSMGTPPYSYQWYEDNSLLPGAVSEVYNPNYPGLYSVVVTDSVDCKGKSSIYKIEVLDLSNWSSGVDVNIFPNPFVDELNVTINSTSEYEWILRDVSGKVIESGMDEYSWKINTSTLPNGMYILNVFNDDEQLIYKIMKQ